MNHYNSRVQQREYEEYQHFHQDNKLVYGRYLIQL